MFRLEGAYETKVGNAIIRGISGGEKRRTSIAEAFVARAQFQCWDNSTRGLDSFTARRVIDLLRASTSSNQSTVAVSLYQASEGMYKSFDKVMLLYEGRQIYFGPIESAASYMISLERASTADFLTSMTNPNTDDALRLQPSTYPLKVYQQVGICIHRSFLRILRNQAELSLPSWPIRSWGS
ncbi:hypothetical protein FJTKL_13860 [Diaporthe vaccinii]